MTEKNVFAALGLKQSDELFLRAKLLNRVCELIRASELSQCEVAEKLGIAQPKVSRLTTGRLSEFSAGTLLQYLSVLGCVEYGPPPPGGTPTFCFP